MSIAFYFSDNNGIASIPLDTELIRNFKLVTSIYDICPRMSLSLSGTDLHLFNEIVLGREIIVSIQEGTLDITMPMKVCYYNKIPAALPTAEILEVELVHSFAFENTIRSKAYGSEATTISNIIDNIIASYADRYFNDTNIEDTDDRGAVRYCLNEAIVPFLQRILKYGSYQRYPVYLYIDALNSINLRSFYSFLDSEISAELFSIQKITTDTSESDTVQSFLMDSFRYTTNTKDSSSSTTTFFTNQNFLTPGQSSITFKSPELYLPEARSYTPAKVNYKNWNLTPSDALAISAREAVDSSIKTYYSIANLKGSMYLKQLSLGNKIKVSLHQNPTKDEAIFGDGEYIIYKLVYYMDSQTIRTKAYLTTAI